MFLYSKCLWSRRFRHIFRKAKGSSGSKGSKGAGSSAILNLGQTLAKSLREIGQGTDALKPSSQPISAVAVAVFILAPLSLSRNPFTEWRDSGYALPGRERPEGPEGPKGPKCRKIRSTAAPGLDGKNKEYSGQPTQRTSDDMG